MSDPLDEPDQLALIRRELGMTGSDRLAREGDRAHTLMKHSPESQSRRVVLDDKIPVEI